MIFIISHEEQWGAIMNVSIKYCTEWNYLPYASRVEEELNATFSGINVQLIPGHGGVFEVTLDNRLIYTKSNTGRFPEAEEITKIIKLWGSRLKPDSIQA